MCVLVSTVLTRLRYHAHHTLYSPASVMTHLCVCLLHCLFDLPCVLFLINSLRFHETFVQVISPSVSESVQIISSCISANCFFFFFFKPWSFVWVGEKHCTLLRCLLNRIILPICYSSEEEFRQEIKGIKVRSVCLDRTGSVCEENLWCSCLSGCFFFLSSFFFCKPSESACVCWGVVKHAFVVLICVCACACVFVFFRETAPHAFQLDLFFNNVSKPSTPVFDRLGR